MAAATTSPVKILTDLGYEIWEMEIPEDFRSALIEAINTLIMTNPSDGRIPILQEAVRAVQKPKFKAKKTRLNVEKVLNRTQPRLKGQKLQEDSEEVQSNNDVLSSILVPRLDGISSALSGIGSILASQLSLERIAYERQRKRDLLNEKREREKSLENEGNTIGKTIKKIIEQPIKSFGERLLQFLKSVGLGAAVLSLYKWLQDNENLKKVKAIADWLGDNGGKLIKSLLKLGRLKIASQVGNLLKKIGSVFLDRVFLKPIMTFTEFLRRAVTDFFSPAGRTIKSKILRQQLNKVIRGARTLNPELMKGVTRKQLGELTEKTIVGFLRAKGYSYDQIKGILGKVYGKGKVTMMMNFIEGTKGTTVSPTLPKVPGATKLRPTVIESDPPFTKTGKNPSFEVEGSKGSKTAGDVQLPKFKGDVKPGKFKRWMTNILNFLKRKGVKDTTGEIANLRSLLLKGAFIGLDVVGMTWDAWDSYRTWNEDKKISSGMYALAAISQALALAGAEKFRLPSVGFMALGAAFEDENFNKGAQLGMELDPSSAFGMGGGDPFLNLLMKKREERKEIEKNLNIQGNKNKIGDQSFLMPNNFADGGSNISFLQGGNQSQVTSGNGSSSKLQEHGSVDEGNVNITSVRSTVGAYA